MSFEASPVRLGGRVTGELETLWALRGLDERLVLLGASIARYPEQRRAIEAGLGGERARTETLKRQIADLQLKHRQLEKDIETLLAEERKYQGQLPLIKKNEEYTALLHEIAGVRTRRSDRETELLLLMEQEQQFQRERPEAERALAVVEAEAAGRLQRLGLEDQSERRQAEALDAERAKLMEALPAATRTRYERIRASRDGRAVVPILKGACGGCFRGQPPQVLQAARRADRVLSCDGCGRLLVWPPEAASA
ncbi:MAG TPA: C4-type zinc ribbon domain-containing protein [Candidatus Eisenbacteria bacterium]|jgi:hypothetical protein